ncbi:MAG TPA: hypothetical protein VI603_19200 [Saprospiraceae bacterium]|nr:hypothetical protein [Saprospiraceae bacterium]
MDIIEYIILSWFILCVGCGRHENDKTVATDDIHRIDSILDTKILCQCAFGNWLDTISNPIAENCLKRRLTQNDIEQSKILITETNDSLIFKMIVNKDTVCKSVNFYDCNSRLYVSSRSIIFREPETDEFSSEAKEFDSNLISVITNYVRIHRPDSNEIYVPRHRNEKPRKSGIKFIISGGLISDTLLYTEHTQRNITEIRKRLSKSITDLIKPHQETGIVTITVIFYENDQVEAWSEE